ncbi:MAG: glycosyltransferase [Edaphobacter sp.]|uniref:glycosyltransferase n=1 Tax=Edaphobacter sp. TaxID=1934404 RepID=UPI00238C78CC|nr:glycosyltransferase [Edaphobacter sp.]MDE1178849.1 glycosyltransferase [Edaphobacter sp.]
MNPPTAIGLSTDPNLLACATQGNGGDDEARLRELVSGFRYTLADFSKRDKRGSARKLLAQLKSRQFNLLVLEGTGIAGGMAAILGRRMYGMPYVVSSGDAVAPFLAARHPAAEPLFRRYEQMLYANSSGFIGWTPYLVGRALTMGATRGITIPGWAPFERTPQQLAEGRRTIRERLGLDDSTVVFGIVGSLTWSTRYQYCYGAELIRAIRRSQGRVAAVVVGDGSGLQKLREIAGDALDRTVHLPGRVPREEVPDWLAAIDVGSIPQSVDGVGSFRYTTKLSEYMATGLPFITNQIPMSYDLDQSMLWRLAGQSPWDPVFLEALVGLMDRLTIPEVLAKRRVTTDAPLFERISQVSRVTRFLHEVLEAEQLHRPHGTSHR